MQRILYMGMIGFVTACQESNLNELKEPYDAGGMAIEVTPAALDFGTLTADDAASLRTFTITSVGVNDLTVSAIELQGNDATSYSLMIPFMETVLSPQEAVDIQVAFLPDGANALQAEAIVFSDDPDNEAVSVQLIGQGAIPDLVITPDPLNFGATYVGCHMENNITLTNAGSDTLNVYSISDIPDAFTINNMPSFPFSLEPNEEYVLDVTFTPDIEGTYSSSINVISDDPDGNEAATQSGIGQYIASYQDYWENPVDPPSDILFSVDQSCSMSDDNALLASNFSTFISQLSNYTTDWQIMIANADNGCNNGGIYTPNVPNYVSSFQSNVQTGGGGSNTEKLLTIVSSAIENTDPGECNYGFLRPNAMLHIITVSDEPDQSSYSYSTYVNQIIAKKGAPENVRISVIYNPNDHWGNYTGAANDTGGLIFDIRNSNWASASNLQLLAEASIISDQYDLNNPALEHTIQVYVNGYEVSLSSGNWHYDSAANAVVFDQSPPQEGDTITITYATAATCE